MKAEEVAELWDAFVPWSMFEVWKKLDSSQRALVQRVVDSVEKRAARDIHYRNIELELKLKTLETELAASQLFARALIARIDRDGGQKQEGESLQMSCHRACEAVAEMQAALDAWAKEQQ